MNKPYLILVSVALATYANMLFNGFVWDDKLYIILNPEFHSFNPLQQLGGGTIYNSLGQYRPIPALYFGTLYQLFRDVPFFYHLTQLALHSLCGLLVFRLFSRFVRPAFALPASLLFLVHPFQVESVSYIAASVSPLFFLFGISALLLGMKDTLSIRRVAAIGGLLLISIMTKETGILFFGMIVVYRLLYRKSLPAPLFLAVGMALFVYGMMRFYMAGIFFEKRHLIPITREPLGDRILHIPAILTHYLTTLAFPRNLVIAQAWTIERFDVRTLYLPLAGLTAIALSYFAGGVYLLKHSQKLAAPYALFGIWFAAGLGLHAQLVPLDWTVADRWMYFPLAGLAGFLAVLAQRVLGVRPRFTRPALVLTCVVLTAFSARTMVRNHDWRSPIALYTHDAAIRDSFDIRSNLAYELGNAGDYPGMLRESLRSVKLLEHEVSVLNLGIAYERNGDYANARKAYYRALEVEDYDTMIQGHDNYELLYMRLAQLLLVRDRNPTEALRIAQMGRKDYPQSYFLALFEAWSRYNAGQKPEAMRLLNELRSVFPGSEAAVFYSLAREGKPLPTQAVIP